jgi:putative endonuclease
MSRVSNKPYFAYVIWSDSARRFYIGISENPEHRLEQHNAGLSPWSAKFGPWRLVHTEEFEDYGAARQREIQLKKQKSGRGFYKLIGRSFEDMTQRVEESGSQSRRGGIVGSFLPQRAQGEQIQPPATKIIEMEGRVQTPGLFLFQAN